MRVYIKKGDIFSVAIDEKHVNFFQYIADDLTQLNSAIIRIFKEIYPKEKIFDWSEIVKGEVEFFTHTFVRNGVKYGYWQKAGHSSEIGVVFDPASILHRIKTGKFDGFYPSF
jgi:hypothetical protein